VDEVPAAIVDERAVVVVDPGHAKGVPGASARAPRSSAWIVNRRVAKRRWVPQAVGPLIRRQASINEMGPPNEAASVV
jgi:hypothetical protein